MPNSQSSNNDINIDVNTTNIVDDKPIYQKNQTLIPIKGSKSIEQIRLEQARLTDLLCIFLILAPIIASVVSFCITRSILSFSFLSFLYLLPSMRRRKEEAVFPISEEDLQIKLKELDVEIERIRNQNALTRLPLFAWLQRLVGKRP